MQRAPPAADALWNVEDYLAFPDCGGRKGEAESILVVMMMMMMNLMMMMMMMMMMIS